MLSGHEFNSWQFTIQTAFNYGTHHWKILRGSYRKLTWLRVAPTITEFRSDFLTDWAIRPWDQLTLRANFVQLLQFHLFAQCSRFTLVFVFVRFATPCFTVSDLLFRIPFSGVLCVVPPFTVPDLLIRILPFRICCSAFVFRVPPFRVLPQPGIDCCLKN